MSRRQLVKGVLDTSAPKSKSSSAYSDEAQRSHIKGLKRKLASEKHEQAKVETLIELSELLHISWPDEAIVYADTALRIAEDFEDKTLYLRCLMVRASALYASAQVPATINALNEAKTLAQMLSNEEYKARCQQFFGTIALSRGELNHALEYLNDALRISEPLELTVLTANIHNTIGMVYCHLFEFAQSLKHLFQSKTLFESLNDDTIILPLTNIGMVYSELNDEWKAIDYFNQSLKQCKGVKASYTAFYACVNLAQSYRKLGNLKEAMRYLAKAKEIGYSRLNQRTNAVLNIELAITKNLTGKQTQAIQHYEEALRSATMIDAHYLIGLCLNGKAEMFAAIGEYKKAIDLLRQACELGGAYHMRDIESAALLHLSSVYEKTKRVQEALNLYRRHIALKGSIEGSGTPRAVAELQYRIDHEREEREKERLRMLSEQFKREAELQARQLTALTLQLIGRNEFLTDFREQLVKARESTSASERVRYQALIRTIDVQINSKSDWKAFEQQFEQLHPSFAQTLLKLAPTLTPAELKVCTFMKLQLPSKSIANLLCTSRRTIEGHRLLIRKKLKLAARENLTSFLAGL